MQHTRQATGFDGWWCEEELVKRDKEHQAGLAGYLGLCERFEGRADRLNGGPIHIERPPRSGKAGLPVKAWTAGTCEADRELKAASPSKFEFIGSFDALAVWSAASR